MSELKRCGFVVVAVLLLVGLSSVPGQAPPPAKPKPIGPPAGDVLQHVPAGCMGFVVVNNIRKFTDKIDGFLKQISPPAQPMFPPSVLDIIRAKAKLAEGFNSNGGFAVVMLDPQQYGVDLVKMITEKAKPPAPGEKVKKPAPLPVVLMIPTTDKTLAGMLAAYKPVKKGDYIKLPREGKGPTYCMVKGNYAMLGPNLKAVRNIAAGGGKSVLTQLSATDKALVARNDLAVWVNMKMLAPTIDAVIVKMQKDAAEGEPGGVGSELMMKKAMARNFSSMREIIKQLADVSAGMRIAKTGVIIEGRVTCLPDSIIGKALAAYRPVAGSLLNRLPNMPYVLAFGARNEPRTPKEFNIKQVNNMLANEPFRNLSAESKARCREVLLGLEDQIDAVQVYIGGITSGGAGKVAMACVMECKSADKVKALLADGVAVADEAFRTSKDKKVKDLTVKYHKALETVGGLKVDVISIDHPEILVMDEAKRKKMKVILGEDKVRLLIASADKKTLVLTLGGGPAFLTEAMKTARGTGTLQTNPGVAKALARLPRERMGVGLLNIGNVFSIIKNIAVALDEDPPAIPPTTADEPFAGAMAIEGSDISFTGHLPTKTIGDLIKTAMMFMMQQMAPPPGAMPPNARPMPRRGGRNF